jgi:hypothetical protein
LRSRERRHQPPREILFLRKHPQTFVRTGSNFRGVGADECGCGYDFGISDHGRVEGQMMALDSPAPVLRTPWRAEDGDVVPTRITPGAFHFSQDLLEGKNGRGFRVALRTQANAEELERLLVLFRGQFCQSQTAALSRDEVPIHTFRRLERQDGFGGLIGSQRGNKGS